MGLKEKIKFDLNNFHPNKKKIDLKNRMRSQVIHNERNDSLQASIDGRLIDTTTQKYLEAINQNASTESYKPLSEYDYHVVILISSYERFEKCSKLIDQFLKQKTQYKFKIILLNNGSTEKDYNVFNSYSDI